MCSEAVSGIWAQWHVLVIPVTWEAEVEDPKFEASLGLQLKTQESVLGTCRGLQQIKKT